MRIENIPPAWDHKLHQYLIQRPIIQQGTAALLCRKPECTAKSCEDCSVQNSVTKKALLVLLVHTPLKTLNIRKEQLCRFNTCAVYLDIVFITTNKCTNIYHSIFSLYNVETCRSERYMKRKYCDIYLCICWL